MINLIKKFFKENYKLIATIFLIGIIVHNFALTNKLFTYDETNHLFGKGCTFESGRWGLELVGLIFPNVSMPWYNGIFAIIILSISFCLVVNILEIKNECFKILICAILMSFPAISNTFVFMYAVTAYSLSIFLSIISVALLKSKKTRFNILGIITIILSLSIYQAYICITMIMIVILLMKDCVDKKKSINGIIKDVIKYVIYIVLSLILYLIITKTINYVLNISFTDYKGLDSMGVFTIKDVINGIVNSYYNAYGLFKESLISGTFALNKYMRLLFKIILLFIIFLTLIKFINLIKRKEKAKAILLLILLIIQPIAINFFLVVNPKIDDVYSIMIYQYVFLIIEPIILYEYYGMKSEKIKKVLHLFFIIIIFQFITIANESYFHSYLVHENVYSFTSELTNRIVETEGYDKSTPVSFIGEYKGDLNTNYYDYFKEIVYMGSSSENNNRILSDMRYRCIKYYIGIDFDFLYEDNKKVIKIRKDSEFKKMNVYPYNNSIKMIDGVLVVKFSE